MELSGESLFTVHDRLQRSSVDRADNQKREDKCNAVKFRDLCHLFEKMGKVQGTVAKIKLLFNKELKNYLQGQSIFPLLRLVLPANDTERGKYGLKQAMIAKTYVNSLHLDKNSDDARRLINWKDPSKNEGIERSKLLSGDFGTILEDVLQSRVRVEYSDTTIGEVNILLDDLARVVNSEEKIEMIKNRVLNNFNAIEQKWLMRIIFQDLKVGLRHENVLNSFYPTALKRYDECTNLRTVCEEEGISSELRGIQLFTHFSPMLAKGFPNSNIGQINVVEQQMNNQPFVMDVKLDGERILCHIGDDNSFVLYTRRGNDYTEIYWPIAHNILTAIRKRGGGLPSNNFSCVIDGEICALDGNTKQYLPFGNNLTVAKVERDYGEQRNTNTSIDWYLELPQWMVFIAFDITYFEGGNSQQIIQEAFTECGIQNQTALSTSGISGEISHLPLIIRRKILEKILVVETNRVEMIPCQYITTNDPIQRKSAIEKYFNEIIVSGKEGLVIKNLLSTYELGEKSRKLAYWVKMKPEYGDHTEDLDVLILGAYYGEGQNFRGEGISTFLCGIRDDLSSEPLEGEDEEDLMPKRFHTVCKVGTGYNFQELLELREKLQPHLIPWDEDHPPEHLAHWNINKRDDRPHVYLSPRHSIVLQIKCAEIVDSSAFSCNYTCRFPRVQRIRYDKHPWEILHLDEVIAIRNKPRKTFLELMNEVENGEVGALNASGKKKRAPKLNADGTLAGRGAKKQVDSQFSIQQTKLISKLGKLFEGESYCVLENDFLYRRFDSTTSASPTPSVKMYTRPEVLKL